MKISSVSKKVLASALSAAMVVAFTPVTALATDLGGDGGSSIVVDTESAVAVVTYTAAGKEYNEYFSIAGKGMQEAVDFAAAKGGVVKLLGNVAADVTINGKVTVDLNGFTWSNKGNDASATTPYVTEAPAFTVAAAGQDKLTATMVAASTAEKGFVTADAPEDFYDGYMMIATGSEVVYKYNATPNFYDDAAKRVASNKVAIVAGKTYYVQKVTLADGTSFLVSKDASDTAYDIDTQLAYEAAGTAAVAGSDLTGLFYKNGANFKAATDATKQQGDTRAYYSLTVQTVQIANGNSMVGYYKLNGNDYELQTGNAAGDQTCYAITSTLVPTTSGVNAAAGTTGSIVAMGDTIYKAVTKASAGSKAYYKVQTTQTYKAAGDLTIIDSSEAKTGKIDGNETDVNAEGTKTYVQAKPAIVVAAGKLTVKGGTITSGAENYYGYKTGAFEATDADAASIDADVKVIDGNVEAIENATVKAIAGEGIAYAGMTKKTGGDATAVAGTVKKLKGAVVEATSAAADATGATATEVEKATVTVTAKVTATGLTAGTIKDSKVSATAAVIAQGATASGKVSGSTIEATVGDAIRPYAKAGSVDVQAGTNVAATALTKTGNANIEDSAITATAGSAADLLSASELAYLGLTGNTSNNVRHAATATAIDNDGTGTFKKVVATATTGDSVKFNDGTVAAAATANAIDASAAGTINSGEYTGKLAGTAQKVKGGKFTAHLKNGENVAVDGGAQAVCGDTADYVIKKAAQETVNIYGTDTSAAAELAVNNLYKDAVLGTDTYKVAATYGEDFDAAKLASILVDADQYANLKYTYIDVLGDKAKELVAADSAVVKAGKEAFNKQVESVDAAAKAMGQAALWYQTNALNIVYKAPTATATTPYSTVAGISDLGLKIDTTAETATGHNNADKVTTYVANEYALFEGAEYKTNEKEAIKTYIVADGKAGDEIKFSPKTATKAAGYYTTKLGTFGNFVENADTVKSELEKLIEQLGGKVESGNATIAELTAQLAKLQDKDAASSIKGITKTIKTKAGVTAKKYTAKVKGVTSDSGAKATFKKANTAGKSKITVAKSGTITIKKGLKKGTYKVKVKGTIGASSKTVTAKIVIK